MKEAILTDSIGSKLMKFNVNELIIKTSEDDKLLGVTYDTIFTVLITSFIFILGVIIDRIAKHIEKNRKNKELRDYFKHLLTTVIKTTSQLANLFKKTYQETHINTGIYSTPPKVLTSNLDRIVNIPDIDLYHAIDNKESLSTILSNIDHVRLLLIQVDTFHNRVREDMQDVRKALEGEINTYISNLTKFVNHLRSTAPRDNDSLMVERLINNLVMDFYQVPDLHKKIQDVYKTIIRPIQLAITDTNMFRRDQFAYSIAEQGKSIALKYRRLRIITIEFRSQYRKIYRSTNEVKIVLKAQAELVKWD